ncbi:hypothetical protein FZI41_04455 [Cronobacter sakazakii]|nr:hypothetical protein FZI41_04455 [Cronobacter sakazakii]
MMAMFVSQTTKTRRETMSKSGNSGTTKTGGRGPSSHPGQGGNWPSTTGNPSGRDRGNAPPKRK